MKTCQAADCSNTFAPLIHVGKEKKYCSRKCSNRETTRRAYARWRASDPALVLTLPVWDYSEYTDRPLCASS